MRRVQVGLAITARSLGSERGSDSRTASRPQNGPANSHFATKLHAAPTLLKISLDILISICILISIRYYMVLKYHAVSKIKRMRCEVKTIELTAGTLTQANYRDPMLTEPVGRLLRKYSGPAVLSMLVMAFYQIADGAMVGRRLGAEALAAVNIIYPVIALFVGLALMFGIGGNARIAVLLGSGRTREARSLLSFLVVLGLALGIATTTIVMWFNAPLIALLGATEEISSVAAVYLLTLAPFFTPFVLSFILEHSVRNDGRPGLATVTMVGAAALNIALDYLFLFVLNLGIAGAALASGISQSLSATVFLVYFARQTLAARAGQAATAGFIRAPRTSVGEQVTFAGASGAATGGAVAADAGVVAPADAQLGFGRPSVSLPVVAQISINGSSEFFASLARGVITLLYNRALVAHVGVTGVAAFALVQYLLMLGWVFYGGIGTGAQPLLSRNHGAGLHGRVLAALQRLMLAGVAIGVVLTAGAWIAAPQMAALFVPNHPAALQVTTEAMRAAAWALLLAPLGIITTIFYTSLEDARSSLLVTLTQGLAAPVVAITFLPRIWAASGIWLVPAVTELATACLSVVLLFTWARARTRVRATEAVWPITDAPLCDAPLGHAPLCDATLRDAPLGEPAVG